VVEDGPIVRLTNACLLTQLRGDWRFLRVDGRRGAIELARELGEWRSLRTVKPAITEAVTRRLRQMAEIPTGVPGVATGRCTLQLPSAAHFFEAFSFAEERDLVVVRFLDEALYERTWPWREPPSAALVAAERSVSRDPAGAMEALRELVATEPPGRPLLTALALMARAASDLGQVRVRALIDEERLQHARTVDGAAYDVIEGLLFTADGLRADGRMVDAEARLAEALALAQDVQRGLPLHLAALDLLGDVAAERGDGRGAEAHRRQLDAELERLVGRPADPDRDPVELVVRDLPPFD
jgi:hypothetical protein